jgi:hypothetical protein
MHCRAMIHQSFDSLDVGCSATATAAAAAAGVVGAGVPATAACRVTTALPLC